VEPSRLSDSEEDVLTLCYDLGGGPRRILSKHCPELASDELDRTLLRLTDAGLLAHSRGVIGWQGEMFEDDIWDLTELGRDAVRRLPADGD
jgi:hypothetical protein